MVLKGFCCEHKLCAEFNIPNLGNHILLYANYNIDGYDGYFWGLTVTWNGCLGGKRQNVEYFLIEASHCSCYGLEDQWKPERTTREMLEKKQFYGNETIQSEILQALDEFERR